MLSGAFEIGNLCSGRGSRDAADIRCHSLFAAFSTVGSGHTQHLVISDAFLVGHGLLPAGAFIFCLVKILAEEAGCITGQQERQRIFAYNVDDQFIVLIGVVL